MFGIYMLIIFVVVKIIASVRDINTDRRYKRKAIERGDKVWFDRNGLMIDVETDTPFVYKTDNNGDTWKVNAYSYKPIENVSEFKRNLLKKEADANGKRYCNTGFYGVSCVSWSEIPEGKTKRVKGERILDSKTNEEYVVRCINGVRFLLNTKTCKFDGVVEEDKDKKVLCTLNKRTANGTLIGDWYDWRVVIKHLNKEQEQMINDDEYYEYKWRNNGRKNTVKYMGENV